MSSRLLIFHRRFAKNAMLCQEKLSFFSAAEGPNGHPRLWSATGQIRRGELDSIIFAD
jgi:hypothetical protein